MPLFCDGCVYLDPREIHPRTKYHRCLVYKMRVIHGSYHPHLLRCDCCVAVPAYQNPVESGTGEHISQHAHANIKTSA